MYIQLSTINFYKVHKVKAMRPQIFETGESVLLLGEGNFTFSLGLLNLGLGLDLTSTCFESLLTETQTENIDVLKSSGVNVMTGIDATKVHTHDLLKDRKFHKIVFNFPHIGGKMKIHLNRELLRLFFLSASNLLVVHKGRIIVSLCRGQGADYQGQRVWADSWQIVDMAGYANLLLEECSPFDWSNYPMYRNVGYRSLEKGFHSEDAVVHIFSLVEKFVTSHEETVLDYYSHRSINEQPASLPIYTRKLKLNILENDTAPTPFILHYLKRHINSTCKCQYIVEKSLLDPIDVSNSISSIVQLWKETDLDMCMYTFCVRNQLGMDFQQSPFTIQTYFFGSENYELFKKSVSEFILNYGIHDYQIKEETCSTDSKIIKKVVLKSCDSTDKIVCGELIHDDQCWKEAGLVLLIHIDILVMKIFSLTSWKQLWSEHIRIATRSEKLFVLGICPHPVSYSLDVSFSINSKFTEESFSEVLWNIAGEIIENATKISEFHSPDSNKQSLCYRLTYLSYDYPVCKKTIINFHLNVLSRILENILDVQVK